MGIHGLSLSIQQIVQVEPENAMMAAIDATPIALLFSIFAFVCLLQSCSG